MASSSLGQPEGHGQGGRPRLGDLRSHLTCVICAGYFIDATTIVECLHTFCRSCILRHLEASSYCPICDVMIHRTKGASSLRADRILQTMVYKLVPGLFTHEMKMRRDFYEMKPYADPELPSWAKGDVASYVPHVFTPDEHLQLRLAMFDAPENRDDEDSPEQRGTTSVREGVPPVRYLRCQAGTPLTVLHKFIRNKFQLPPNIQVQLIYGHHVLPEDISLMDIGYLYRPLQDAPVRLEYRLVRKRPAAPVTQAVVEAEAVSGDVKTEPEAVDATSEVSASTSAVETSESAVAMPEEMVSMSEASTSQVHAEESETESSDVTSEPPTKRRRTDEEPRQPVVLLERLFDADDEEPTSPKEVEEIIATLDAEEGTPQAAASPTGSDVDEENIVQQSSPQPGPFVSDSVADDDADERGCDEGCAAGGSMDCAPDSLKDECGSGDACTSSGEGCADDVGEGVDVDIENVDECNDAVCDDVPVECGDAVCEAVQESEDASAVGEPFTDSDAKGSTSSVTTTDAGSSAMSQTSPGESNQATGSKAGEVEADSNYDDDATSECGLVVDEEASSVSPDMEVDERSVETSTSLALVSAQQSSNDGAAELPREAKDVNTSSDTSPESSEAVHASAESEGSVKRSSVTPERDSSCSAGTQTSLCGVSKRPEHPSPSPPVVSTSTSLSSPKQHTSDVGHSVECKQSETKGGVRSMSSVSCGTHDMDELSVPSPKATPTKVDCSVQTMPTETDKPLHSTQNKPSLSQGSADIRKHISTQSCQSGVKLTEDKSVKANEQRNSPAIYSRSPQTSHPKISHPELASRLTQPTESMKDLRQGCDVTKTHSANILQVPNAPSTPSQAQKSHKTSATAGKSIPDNAAKRSPDSSSMLSAKAPLDVKQFFKEIPRSSSGVSKYLEKNHKRALTGSPLDLSTRANKTAADSTSMVLKRPGDKTKSRKQKPAKAQGTQTIHSIVKSLSRSEHISLTPIPSGTPKPAKSLLPPKPQQQHHQPMYHEVNPAAFQFPAGMVPHDFYSSPLHVNTSMASRLSYDMAMRNLLTLSHMAMAQGGMVRPPHHMFPMQHMFPPRPKSHDFHPIPDPSLLRQQSEAARMGASAKKASPTAGTTAPQLRSPTGLTSASIQHMEDLTRTVGKRTEAERHSVTLTPLPPK